MDLKRLTISDLFGRFYLREGDPERITSYFRTVDALRPFLNSREWTDSITGYYINAMGDYDMVRLSYFSADPEAVQKAINKLYSDSNIKEAAESEKPHEITIAGWYGGEELRFRRFLYLYTLIGLDIMKYDLLNARCLMATYRWQVMLSRGSARKHFEKTFEAQSPAYNSLSREDKYQFLEDLGYWPNPPQVDWAHMMVNMILPGDVNDAKGLWNYFLSPKPAKTIDEINIF